MDPRIASAWPPNIRWLHHDRAARRDGGHRRPRHAGVRPAAILQGQGDGRQHDFRPPCHRGGARSLLLPEPSLRHRPGRPQREPLPRQCDRDRRSHELGLVGAREQSQGHQAVLHGGGRRDAHRLRHHGRSDQLLLRSLAVAVALFRAAPGAAQEAAPLVIDIRDVGQAEMAVVETPDSQWIVLDAAKGSTAAFALTTNYHAAVIALAIGSHRHQDHIGGMSELIATLPVRLYVGDTARTDYRTLTTTMLRWRLEKGRVPVQLPGADTIMVGAVRIILLPQMPKDFARENNNSIVVRLEYGYFAMLFPGDAENDEQQWLLRFY